ncbi:fimbrial protein [Phocaeicola plebeius]|uniref:fimbrial tip adhesin FimD n=1 Tax=Phocaeicola plebeius TaxID=310297 RepID=UPI0026ECCAD6|nr:fimbrial protein [Phocaeicola plebeius]
MIDKKYIIRVLGRMICFMAVQALATACTGDELLDSSANGTEQEGLSISLTLDGMQLASRSASVQSLNEDAVKRMDVFLFGPDESFKKYATSGDGNSSVEKVTLYQGGSWKNEFVNNCEYTLYVLANYKGEADLSQITTVQGLKDLVATDKDIALWEGMSVGSGKYEGKTFLMDGKKVFLGSDLNKSQSTLDIPVEVKRAAVKVEVTLKYSDEWKNKFTASDLEAQFANYATATAAFAEAPMLDADKRGFTTYPEATTDVKDRFSSAPVFVEGKEDDKLHNGSKIRFYAYVNAWEQEVSNETMFLIDLPGDIQKDNASVETLKHNFYKIPIVPNSQEKILNRNTFYQVTAVVDMEGSSTIDEPVELKDVKIEVAGWKPTTINVGTGDNPEYLMLNEYHVEIRNVDGYDGLRFYSSAPIDNVEIVGFASDNAAASAGVDFTYPGNAGKIPGVFFVNKDNERTEVASNVRVSVNWDKDVNNGQIYLTSPNPVNVTKRYITLKVTSGDNVKYVVVEQYPLEYIQPIPGFYSYRDDFQAVNVIESDKTCTWESVFTPEPDMTPILPREDKTVSFASKVCLNGEIFQYKFAQNEDEKYHAYTGSKPKPQNEMMYFVTITQANGDYKIARPLMEKNAADGQEYAVPTLENDNLVSPTFMLTSQLGAAGTTGRYTWEDARKHCANYVETYQVNGKTYHLKDWRLPTSAEIKVILKYQTNPDAADVMDKALSRKYYYDVDGKDPVQCNSSSDENIYIRCIRDVKPDDAFLNINKPNN